MNILTSWLKRKKAAVCILAAIFSVSLFVIINSGEKIKENKGGSYIVKIKHYGIDAKEMERSVTIPLEDALSAISGVISVQSSTENSQSRVFIRFNGKSKGCYEAVRDVAQRVYETLPSSTQRPEIYSSDNSMIPVWSAAVYIEDENETIPQILEKIVKPKLERLEGAGEVLVTGAGLKEIVIILDQEKIAIAGLDPSAIGAALAMNDSIFSGGSITHGNKEIIVTIDALYDFNSLENALIPIEAGKFIELSQIAQITEHKRQPDVFSRLNGKKTAGIAIMGRHDADLRKLSFDIKKELAALSLPFNLIVLSDLGAEEAAAFRSVLNAALLGAIMVSIISFLLNRTNKKTGIFQFSGFFCSLFVPIICLVSIAVLSISGFAINRFLLAGIAAGIGTAVDAVILCSEKLRKCISLDNAKTALVELAGPLTAGAATTVAALLPLLAIDNSGTGIIAYAIASVCITSLVMALTLLPPLLLWGMKNNDKKEIKIYEEKKSEFYFTIKNVRKNVHDYFKWLKRCVLKLLAVNIRFCIRHPAIILAISIILTASAIFSFFIKGVDTSSYGSYNSIYAQIEFDKELLTEETDRLLAAYGEKIAANEGIINVETGARTGSGSLLISFDPKKIKTKEVKELARQIPIPEGFVFFHENTGGDRYWEIKIFGDEDQKCREIAEELAFYCSSHSLVKEWVLNFKEGSSKLILQPDREIFAEAGIGFANAATKLRTAVYGPVVYKRLGSDGETDVRIRTASISTNTNDDEDCLFYQIKNRQEVFATQVNGLQLDTLMNYREETEPSSIRREDRRRTASITISTMPMDPRRVKKEIEKLFEKINFPSGYYAEFDPEAIHQAQALSGTVFSLILAVVFCYMIIASINESFAIPLIVLCAIPPSLSVPALFLTLLGGSYNTAVACAFIAVSGMTVNAAVFCTDSLRRKINKKIEINPTDMYIALRRKITALLSTGGTTVAGVLPFLFLKEESNTLIKTLSLTGAVGVTFSCICSITVIPSLFVIFNKIKRRKI